MNEMKVNKVETKIPNHNPSIYQGRTYDSANEAWEMLYQEVSTYGNVVSPRGNKIKEVIGCDIRILNPYNNLIYSLYRSLSPVYLAREYIWYKNGSRDASVAPNSNFWKSIANEDGTVNSNYGAYIFVKESDGKSVWDKTVDILKKDKDSRQAIIQIPIMPSRGKKDTPCTSSIQFFIRPDYTGCEVLNAVVYMRSCDLVAGFCYDIFQFTMWQVEMAEALGIPAGYMQYIAGSLHVYEEDWIENREPFYRTIINEPHYSYHRDQSFRDDLALLAKNGKKTDPGALNNPQLAFMLNNMRVWKRDNW